MDLFFPASDTESVSVLTPLSLSTPRSRGSSVSPTKQRGNQSYSSSGKASQYLPPKSRNSTPTRRMPSTAASTSSQTSDGSSAIGGRNSSSPRRRRQIQDSSYLVASPISTTSQSSVGGHPPRDSHRRTTSASPRRRRPPTLEDPNVMYDERVLVKKDSEDHSAATQRLSNIPLQVPYDGGATELFSAIQDGDWERAIVIVREDDSQARIWVQSKGADNTVFDWSVWRRLPIHEACRRQPPPLVVAGLLRAYPESAHALTHFDELPVHLAVGYGACPEVVNMLLVSHVHGVLTRDRGGRTPMELLRDTGILREDHIVIKESLERCAAMYKAHQSMWEAKLSEMQSQHDFKVKQMSMEHVEVVKKRDKEIDDLTRQVNSNKGQMLQMSQLMAQLGKRVKEKDTNLTQWKGKCETAENLAENLESERSKLSDERKQLEGILKLRDEEIAKLKVQVEGLSEELTNLYEEHDEDVVQSMTDVLAHWQQFMDSQRDWVEATTNYGENLSEVLKKRGLRDPTKEKRKNRTTTTAGPTSEEVDSSVVAAAAAAVAAAALSSDDDGDDWKE